MTNTEQIEYISVESAKLGISYGEWERLYGHTLPKPEPTKYKEHEWYEGIEGKKCKIRKKIELVCQNPECGAPFLALRSDARFCPVCKEERQRRLAAEKRKQKRKEAKK